MRNFTAWSKQVIGSFARLHRTVYRTGIDRSRGVSGALAILRFPPPVEADRPALRRGLAERLLPAVDGLPNRLGSFLLESDLETTNAPERLGGPFQRRSDEEWLVGIQATDAAEAEAALAALLPSLAEALPGTAPQHAVYRFLYGRWRDSL